MFCMTGFLNRDRKGPPLSCSGHLGRPCYSVPVLHPGVLSLLLSQAVWFPVSLSPKSGQPRRHSHVLQNPSSLRHLSEGACLLNRRDPSAAWNRGAHSRPSCQTTPRNPGWAPMPHREGYDMTKDRKHPLGTVFFLFHSKLFSCRRQMPQGTRGKNLLVPCWSPGTPRCAVGTAWQSVFHIGYLPSSGLTPCPFCLVSCCTCSLAHGMDGWRSSSKPE